MRRNLLSLLLLAVVSLVGLTGCTWGNLEESTTINGVTTTRKVGVGSLLKSTDIGKVEASTPDGGKLNVEGYKSDASAAIDLAKSVIQAAK